MGFWSNFKEQAAADIVKVKLEAIALEQEVVKKYSPVEKAMVYDAEAAISNVKAEINKLDALAKEKVDSIIAKISNIKVLQEEIAFLQTEAKAVTELIGKLLPIVSPTTSVPPVVVPVAPVVVPPSLPTIPTNS